MASSTATTPIPSGPPPASSSDDNIFGLKKEPYYVWFYGHIAKGVQKALALEKAQEKALELPTEEEQQTELERIRKEALKTNWPIAEENKADWNYEKVSVSCIGS